MSNPLADIENIAFFDTETRAEDGVSPNDGSVVTAGTYRYAKKSFVIVSTFGIGEQPVFDVSLNDGFDGDWLSWDRMPDQLKRFHDRVEAGKAWYAAWNMGFDRAAWNNGTYDFPLIRPEHTIDVMAQAVASNMPAALEGASRFIGRGGKQQDGKFLINMFCRPGGETPQQQPDNWTRFKSYGRIDTHELREVFRATRPLPFEEWEEYWASEHINDRGMMIDVPYCERAAAVSTLDMKRTNELLWKYTNGQIKTVNQHQKLADWVWDSLAYSEARELLISEYDEESEDDNDYVTVKLSLERSRVTKLITFFEAMREREHGLSERDELLLKVLQLREFGASAAPKKFGKMLNQHDDDVLKGGYVWNGAPQTGRFSSKGVQVHNLTRSVLGKKGVDELPAIEMINELEI